MARGAGNGELAVRPTYTVYWTDAAVSEAEFLANGQSVVRPTMTNWTTHSVGRAASTKILVLRGWFMVTTAPV